MTVSINADGTIESVEINRSSGHKVLDEAAKHIVELAAPYSRFPMICTKKWIFWVLRELGNLPKKTASPLVIERHYHLLHFFGVIFACLTWCSIWAQMPCIKTKSKWLLQISKQTPNLNLIKNLWPTFRTSHIFSASISEPMAKPVAWIKAQKLRLTTWNLV